MYYNLCITIRFIYAVAATVFETGVSDRRVSEQMVVHPFVIIRLMQRLQATGIVERLRSNRPHKTTPREDRLNGLLSFIQKLFNCAWIPFGVVAVIIW